MSMNGESVVTLDGTTDDESSELSIVSNETPKKKGKSKESHLQRGLQYWMYV